MLVAFAVFGALFPDYLFHWDEVQLTLGLERFDPRSHQPHPPGYYLFIVLGRLLRPFVATPENALRVVAALAGAAFVGLVGWCLPGGWRLLPRAGMILAAALYVLCSPIVQFHSVAALTYTMEAACWLGILLAVGSKPRGWRLLLLAFGMGLAGGFRQTLIVWGLVVVALVWLLERSWLDMRAALRFLAALVVGVLSWSLPMLVEVGGWREYATVSSPLLQGNIWEKSIFHEGTETLVRRLASMPLDLWLAAGPWLLVAAGALVVRFHPRFRERLARWDLLPLGAALSFFFYLFLIYDSDGYILSVAFPLTGYAMLAAAALMDEARTQAIGAFAAALLAVSLTLLPGGQAVYAAHDARLEARIDAIGRHIDPATTVLVTSHEYWRWSFRHVMYYLPEHTTLQLLPDRFFPDASLETPYLTARQHAVRFSGPDGFDIRSLGASVEQVLYVIPHDVERFVTVSCAPFMEPFGVSAEERLPLIRLSQTTVRVERSQLHCSPSPG
jgi:hypothetical protein